MKRKRSRTQILLFVEGPTEAEFYKALIKHMRERRGKSFNSCIDYIDLKGVGNFNSAIRHFDRWKKKNPDDEIYVYLCYDTDVFQFSGKPVVDMKKCKRQLQEAGAKEVFMVEAKYSIEDWFLLDYSGVCRHLGLPANTPKPSGRGQDVMKMLFRKANRVYTKGCLAKDLIEQLDMSKILLGICQSIKSLCEELELECNTICH